MSADDQEQVRMAIEMSIKDENSRLKQIEIEEEQFKRAIELSLAMELQRSQEEEEEILELLARANLNVDTQMHDQSAEQPTTVVGNDQMETMNLGENNELLEKSDPKKQYDPIKKQQLQTERSIQDNQKLIEARKRWMLEQKRQLIERKNLKRQEQVTQYQREQQSATNKQSNRPANMQIERAIDQPSITPTEEQNGLHDKQRRKELMRNALVQLVKGEIKNPSSVNTNDMDQKLKQVDNLRRGRELERMLQKEKDIQRKEELEQLFSSAPTIKTDTNKFVFEE